MAGEREFKRIERVAKGEQVVVPMIQEDLQEMWTRLHILGDDWRRACEDYKENPCEATAKVREGKMVAANKARLDFWQTVHERYGFWDKSIGLRDGWALVVLPDEDDKMKKGFKKFMKDILDGIGEDGFGGIDI